MRIKFKRGTVEQWREFNPILREGEIGRVSGSGRFKVGDGKTRFEELPWATTLPESVVVGPAGEGESW